MPKMLCNGARSTSSFRFESCNHGELDAVGVRLLDLDKTHSPPFNQWETFRVSEGAGQYTVLTLLSFRTTNNLSLDPRTSNLPGTRVERTEVQSAGLDPQPNLNVQRRG